MKQIEFAHELLDAVALTPSHFAVFFRIAFDRALDAFQIFAIERRAKTVEDFGQVIDELLVGELVGFDEIDIFGNGIHPLLGEADSLGPDEVGKLMQRARGCVGHGASGDESSTICGCSNPAQRQDTKTLCLSWCRPAFATANGTPGRWAPRLCAKQPMPPRPKVGPIITAIAAQGTFVAAPLDVRKVSTWRPRRLPTLAPA